MNKNGFTLAEALIAVGIVAFSAAIVVPALQNAIPDKYKINVVQTYNSIVSATNVLLEDDSIYYSNPLRDNSGNLVLDNSGKLRKDCYGLNCTRQPLSAPYNEARFSGNQKYPNLLADKLGVTITSPLDQNPLRGTLPNGVEIEILRNNNGTYSISLTFDSRENNCSYDVCRRNPNVFDFDVADDGTVLAHDPLTRAYISNPVSNNKKADRVLAKSLLKSTTPIDEYIAQAGSRLGSSQKEDSNNDDNNGNKGNNGLTGRLSTPNGDNGSGNDKDKEKEKEGNGSGNSGASPLRGDNNGSGSGTGSSSGRGTGSNLSGAAVNSQTSGTQTRASNKDKY